MSGVNRRKGFNVGESVVFEFFKSSLIEQYLCVVLNSIDQLNSYQLLVGEISARNILNHR